MSYHSLHVISIHAPHARSDCPCHGQRPARRNFNPRSSCEERLAFERTLLTFKLFQSTLLMRGATRYPASGSRLRSYFNPRSSCEERPICSIGSVGSALFQSTLLMRGATSRIDAADVIRRISIHAPHARSDLASSSHQILERIISIHAPHARSDCSRPSQRATSRNFNPRSSCEERRGHSS